jgi:hypothetical protein
MWDVNLEKSFQKHDANIKACTARFKDEIAYAYAKSVSRRIDSIHNLLENESTHVADRNKQFFLPQVRLILHPSNDRFYGRRDILSALYEELDPSRRPKRQRSFALYGFGGAGKTQIALEYTYLHLDEYRVVIWIVADNEGKIQQGFIEAAVQLGIEGPPQSAAQAKNYVLERLSSTGSAFHTNIWGERGRAMLTKHR